MPKTTTQPDGTRIKRSVLRVLGFDVLTTGLYQYYWFFVTKNQLKRELGNDQHVGWQTVGLAVPILQAFVLYWIFRDINSVRQSQKLAAFPAVWYVVVPYVLIFLAFLMGIGAIVSIIGAIGAGSNSGTATGLVGAGILSGLVALLTLVVAGILEFVFLGLAVSKLNQYWDASTNGKASAARLGKGEIAVVVVGLLINILNFSTSGSNSKHSNTSSAPAVTEVVS